MIYRSARWNYIEDQLVLRPALEHPDIDHWKRICREVLKRQHGACACCPSTRNLEGHHRTYSRWGIEMPEDVSILCQLCHASITQSLRERRAQARWETRQAARMLAGGDRLLAQALEEE